MTDNLPAKITDEEAIQASFEADKKAAANLPIDLALADKIGMGWRARRDPSILNNQEEIIKAAFATRIRRRFTCHAHGVALTPGDQNADASDTSSG